MTMTTVEEGPGWRIDEDDHPHTVVPYYGVVHEDGARNHGFVDLRDQPELAEHIPELSRSPGLTDFVKAVNERGSPLMSIGCDCGLFPVDDARPGEPTCYIGSYVDVTFRDASRNAVATNLVNLAKVLLARVAVSQQHHFNFHMIVERLKGFWGLPGRYSLMVKTCGFGRSEENAWDALDHAAFAMAAACRNYRRGAE